MHIICITYRNPNACGYRKVAPLVHERMGSDGMAYTVGKLFCLPGVCTGGKHHKFLTAIAHKQIVLTHAGIYNLCNTLQNHVARVVTIGIVDLFKMVDIKHEARALMTKSQGFPKKIGPGDLQKPTVMQSCEGIIEAFSFCLFYFGSSGFSVGSPCQELAG